MKRGITINIFLSKIIDVKYSHLGIEPKSKY